VIVCPREEASMKGKAERKKEEKEGREREVLLSKSVLCLNPLAKKRGRRRKKGGKGRMHT